MGIEVACALAKLFEWLREGASGFDTELLFQTSSVHYGFVVGFCACHAVRIARSFSGAIPAPHL